MNLSTEAAQFHVTMLGARGVGKTTMLTALWNEFGRICGETGLRLTPQGATQDLLEGNLIRLKTLADSPIGTKIDPAAGVSGTKDMTSYQLRLFHVPSKTDLDLVFNDYPGQWLKDHTLMSQVIDVLTVSSVILVAVDVPALMNLPDGRHEERNRPSKIAIALETALQQAEKQEEVMERRLVLFTLMRGERWLQNGCQDHVLEKFQERFASSLTLLKEYSETIATVICPVQTLGSVHFEKWDCDATTPLGNELAQFVKARAGEYAPMDCDQPLRYLLSFLMRQIQEVFDSNLVEAKKVYERRSWLERLRDGAVSLIGIQSPKKRAMLEWATRCNELCGAMDTFAHGRKEKAPFQIVAGRQNLTSLR